MADQEPRVTSGGRDEFSAGTPSPMNRIDRLARALESRAPVIGVEPDRWPAAVAVVFAPDPESLLLIQRAERQDDRWSGQMALPGGRWSNADPDLLATA